VIDDSQVRAQAAELRDHSLVITTGIGKSGKVADLVAALWQSVGIQAVYIHATDLLHGGLNIFMGMDELDTSIVMFSHSGTTDEIRQIMLEVGKSRDSADLWLVTSVDIEDDLIDDLTVYDFTTDGSIHGTIPFQSLIEQMSWGARVACAVADNLEASDLLAGHPSGALALKYQREIHDE
jgi:D-arabinose 5-phosphate isomerase GutQ